MLLGLQMARAGGAVARLIDSWVYGGFLAGVVLLVLTPILVRSWSAALASAFLCLPLYMLHQYEEHDDDRFRRHFNRTIGHGRKVLSPLVVFVANVPGVWGVISVSIWLAATIDVGFGLIAVYLVLVNAVVHVVSAVVFRGYNPGLATGVLFFLPVGGYGLAQIAQAGAGTAPTHLLALALAVGLHAAILVHVRNEARRPGSG
jgi:hypothetical protein